MGEEQKPPFPTPARGTRSKTPACDPPGARVGLPRPTSAAALLALALVSLSAFPAFAAPVGATPPGSDQTAPSLPAPEEPTAFLVTVGPGGAVWERFGHNLIWIHDPEAGTDEGYNYGLFSFEQENFLLNFVRGHMRYWMQGWDVRDQIEGYGGQGRAIWIQELALEPERVRELQAFLQWNERPENRFYRYDYYWDNCSTRVRDALDRVLDGRLHGALEEEARGATYRDHTLQATEAIFWAWGWLHFAMGPMTDRELSAWEAAFIPMELQRHVRQLAVPGPGSELRPLVRDEWTAVQGRHPPKAEGTTRRIGSFGAAGAGVALLFVVFGARSRRGDGRSRLALHLLGIPWLLFWGALGTLIALMWAFTDHVVATGNLNLFHANLVHVALAFLLPAATREGETLRGRMGHGLAWALGIVSVAGLGAQLAVPALDQVNGEYLALLVPPNLALAWAVGRSKEARTEA